MKTTATTRRGFAGVSCPRCAQEGGVQVKLDDLSFTCAECSEDFTVADVRAMLDAWTRVLDWVELAPAK